LSSVGAQGVGVRQWSEERRKARQRREVMVKYGKKDAASVARHAQRQTASSKAEPIAAGESLNRPGRDRCRAGRARRRRSSRRSPPPTPIAAAAAARARARRRRRRRTTRCPPTSLLDPPKAESKIDERELMDSARCSRRSAASSRRTARWCRSHPGPVVTTFE
jgi:DNA segregation ATPase FtsK/SpoIIIE-like protein